MIGQSLLHYRILEKIGEGGMGEVYRAEDLRLHRQVAVKVLPDLFAADPERLARFEREAKLLAALSHANIAAIYGLEEAEGKRFLILELVEGETLAERLGRGPLPVDEALEVCRQVAEGLEAAHEKSIVHRDLKPSNIKLTPEGQVKILDFGLARAFLDKSAVGVIIDSPTITAAMTQPGIILGTAAYMSPEQAKGKQVDKRADIWAFGCILFECLTGRTTFPGETITEVLASVLKGEPDWDALPKDLPANIRAVLHRCLQKDRNLRFHEIADARIELFEAPLAPLTIETARRFPWIWVIAVGVVALLAGVLIGVLADRNLRKPAAAPVIRTGVSLPPGMQLTRTSLGPIRTEVALAPDGSFLVFSASPDGSEAKAMLYKRPLDSAEATAIPRTEGARTPFFSPDGQWIGFWAKGKLEKMAAKGGIPDSVCDVSEVPIGIYWGSDGRIIFSIRREGLRSVSAGGGTQEALIHVDSSKEETLRLPYLLPGGKALIFTAMPHLRDVVAQIKMISLETNQRKVLIEDGADSRYLPTGHLVFVRRGTLMAAPFSLNRLEITGPAVTVTAGLLQAFNGAESRENSGAGQYSVSESGTLIYASGGIFPEPESQFFWVDRSGRAEPWTAFGRRPAFAIRLSPDGRSAAYYTLGLNRHLGVYDIQRDIVTKLTSDGAAVFPTWTPDGKRVAFAWSKAGPVNIWWKPLDGSGEMEQLTKSEFSQYPGSWTQDGRYLALVEANPATDSDILVLKMEDRQLSRFVTTPSGEQSPDFSPDGRWLAYASNESGRLEIYIRSFPGGDRRITISNQGGMDPLWAPDGRELFYWNLDYSKLMKVNISPVQDSPPGAPMVLFEFATGSEGLVRAYDITPDGRRFLIRARPKFAPTEVTQLNLVQNWFEELKRLCPVKK
jgi:serine/threonine-protein kinase